MLLNKTGLKNKCLTATIYLLVGLSGLLYSFKPAGLVKNTGGRAAGSLANDLTGWIQNLVNEGYGYNFATVQERAVLKPYSYSIEQNVQQPVPKAINYKLRAVASPLLLELDSNIPPAGSNDMIAKDNSALSSIASYVPAERLASISEAEAQQLIDKASSLPSSLIERVKNDPTLLSKAKSMSVNALINYKID